MNPLGEIPVLQKVDGSFLSESVSIVEYLDGVRSCRPRVPTTTSAACTRHDHRHLHPPRPPPPAPTTTTTSARTSCTAHSHAPTGTERSQTHPRMEIDPWPNNHCRARRLGTRRYFDVGSAGGVEGRFYAGSAACSARARRGWAAGEPGGRPRAAAVCIAMLHAVPTSTALLGHAGHSST